MELKNFIRNFADQFEEDKTSEINSETVFKDIEGWSSFSVLTIIAMVDEFYNVKLTNDDIRKSKTVADIFNIVISRIK